MNRDKSAAWIALMGTILFLAILWRKILRLPVAQDTDEEKSARKNRPVA